MAYYDMKILNDVYNYIQNKKNKKGSGFTFRICI